MTPVAQTMKWQQPQTGGWTFVRVKHLASRIGSGKTPRGGNEVYVESGVLFLRSMNVYDHGLRLDEVVYINRVMDEAMAQTRVQPGDVLLNITGASIGRTCIVPAPFQPANVNQHVCIIRPRQGTNPKFLSYAFKSSSIKDQIRTLENGSSREGLNFEQVGNLGIHLSRNFNEQTTIAAYLDRKTGEIDAVIAAKERMIELLQDQRHALISRAVTRGLEATVPTKDSGIAWLGRVPAHWSVERLKFPLSLIEQGWSPQCDNRPADEDEWGVLKVGCVNGSEFDSSEQKALPAGVEPEVRYEIKPGDILLSRGNTRELVGSAALVRETRPRLLLCDLLYRLRFRHDRGDAEYIVHQLRSSSARFQIEREASGTSNSMKKIGQETIREFVICLPPLAEQNQIVAYIRREAGRIDGIIKANTEQVAKLREYRQTLISAAVTGKIDLRQEVA